MASFGEDLVVDDLEHALAQIGDRGEGGPGQVEAAAVDVGAAIVDADNDGFAVGRVGHPYQGVERKRLVSGRERVGVEGFAVRGALRLVVVGRAATALEVTGFCRGWRRRERCRPRESALAGRVGSGAAAMVW